MLFVIEVEDQPHLQIVGDWSTISDKIGEYVKRPNLCNYKFERTISDEIVKIFYFEKIVQTEFPDSIDYYP